MRFRTSLPAAYLLAFALVACGELPQPFATDASELNPADSLQPIDAAGIVVTVEGGAAADAAALASAIAQALREREVPATTSAGNEGSLSLVAEVTDAGGVLAARWSLSGPDDAAMGGFEQRLTPAEIGDQRALALRASEAAAAVIGLLGDAARGNQTTEPPVFVVLPVAGAPGDGPVALMKAMEMALASGGARLAEEPGPGVFVVSGEVSVTEDSAESQRLAVLWEVHDPEGKRLGTVAQENSVPTGRLEGRWGSLAAAIASGGADGVRNLVRRTADTP